MLRIFPLNAKSSPPFLEPYLLTYSKKIIEIPIPQTMADHSVILL